MKHACYVYNAWSFIKNHYKRSLSKMKHIMMLKPYLKFNLKDIKLFNYEYFYLWLSTIYILYSGMYTQQKKFLDTYKSSIFTKHASYYANWKLIMWRRWMSSSFWYQTWRNLLINSRVLIIWMETGTFLKVANEAIQLYRADLYVDVCWWMVTFATFQDVPVSIQVIRTLCHLSTISYKFGIKLKKTAICFPWYAFI